VRGGHFNGWRAAKVKRRPRHEPGEMNRTEAAYASHLEFLKKAGEIRAWAFEALKLRLADRTWYSVDFLVQLEDDTLEGHELKGTAKTKAGNPRELWEEDARVKFKVAAEIHPWLTFRSVRKAAAGEQREWILTPDPARLASGAADRALPAVQPPAMGEVVGTPSPYRGSDTAVAGGLREASRLTGVVTDARSFQAAQELIDLLFLAAYARIGGQPITITATPDGPTECRWRRMYPCCELSDERQLEAPGVIQALQGLLEWELDADSENNGRCPRGGILGVGRGAGALE